MVWQWRQIRRDLVHCMGLGFLGRWMAEGMKARRRKAPQMVLVLWFHVLPPCWSVQRIYQTWPLVFFRLVAARALKIQDCSLPTLFSAIGLRCNNYVLYYGLSISIYVNTCKVRFYFFWVLFIQLGSLLRLNKFNLVLTMVVKVNLSSGFFSGFVKFLEKLFLSRVS